MLLSPKTRIAELLKAFPFLEEFLPRYNPKFKKLLNPVARKTIGKIATLQMAASNADIEVTRFIADLRDAIKSQTGQEVGIMSAEEMAERAKRIRQILEELHAAEGKNIEELQARFAAEIKDVSPTEIAEIEQQLIKTGISEEEITSMCDLHVAVFRESLDKQDSPGMQPGHPVHTFRAENREFEKLARRLSELTRDADEQALAERKDDLEEVLDNLGKIDIHYTRKENQLFPYLEKHGVQGPPQVMWGVHDQIREHLKAVRVGLTQGNLQAVKERSSKLAGAVLDMIYKEEQILYPMALEKLDETEWWEIRKGEPEIGYALIDPPGEEWRPEIVEERSEEMAKERIEAGSMNLNDLPEIVARNMKLPLDVGELTLEQINIMLKHLPVDVSFVDESDELRYYSDTPERIFARTPAVIGRKVQNCHPPKSVHVVNKILEEFKKGSKDAAEFWIELKGKFIHIRYFAMRDADGNYRGTLEVSQDVTEIRKLEGERRLLDWED
ncbi:hypothetical protein CEE36_02970 [candidate division TA06 bacterium B3_TA06]|uniref:PAC domain-containing protein n=1 Tax=candidate division TA06 bacterium B3_TA06 TaxID=2012487 RepID=A0A532V939_UNCT6|nr:MAG: hypothetical protein CEE36_02970 [candidate division TA06 bacterium B3_TA06]